jgi:hypothetical protein
MTETARTRPSFNDVFGRLRAMRGVGRGGMLCVCTCQHTAVVEIADLLSGKVSSCTSCAPLLPEQRKDVREEAASITAGSEGR